MKSNAIASMAAKYGRMADFRGYERSAQALFRAALVADPAAAFPRRMLAKRKPPSNGLRHLRNLIIGTTGTCNASCVHCPTGKASTAHVPRSTMSMDLFCKIIDGVVENDIDIVGQISFGLFGDGLVDPLVIERAEYVHNRLPDLRLSVNTNGAAFNPKRHEVLGGLVADIALHCESIVPETYDYLMAPLRLKNVRPKIEAMLRTFSGKVKVSVPVSRANLGEIDNLRAWFEQRGASVVFDPMSNRCAEDSSVFDALSLAPVRNMCDASIMADLVVDCDGLVLGCCQDFQRLEPIGDFADSDFLAVMTNLERKAFEQMLADARHDERATCSRCYSDQRTPDFPRDWVRT